MPSHMSTIGFPVDDADEFGELAQIAAQQGLAIAMNGLGAYFRWEAGEGAELWVQVAPDGSITGMNPHFAGKSRLRAGIVEAFGPEDSPLEGSFRAWANPAVDSAGSGIYPFIFDSPDFATHRALELPAVLVVQIAAFAHALKAFPDDDSYFGAQTETPKFAVESFIPSGLLRPDAGPTAPSEARAIFSGRVVETARMVNPFSGEAFHWALIRTLGGQMDVVVDPEVMVGTMVPGGVVRGSFWLSGRFMPDKDPSG